MTTCPICGTENPIGSRFCGSCGTPLGAAVTGDVRKTVTVMFCDLTGSTSLGDRLDPEAMRGVVTRFFEETKRVLERHGGSVEKFIGDAVMAIFGVPAVHEDDAVRAVRAAAEMRERIRELNKELERERGVTIEARIGVNTGEVMAGTGEAAAGGVVTGDAVNVAARLEQAAEPGQILIGESTFRLVRDAVTVDPVAPLRLKGKAQPVAAYALVDVAAGAAGVARHLGAPMVGRERELQTLQAAIAGAARDRVGALATVLGPPGVGKSRLVEEFVSRHRDDARVTHGRCLSYGDGITYWPVVEILTATAGIADLDGPDEIRAKIQRLLGGSAEATIVVERLAEFLGLSGATAAPEETHWAIRKLFESLASERPLVVVFEDLHWAEPALLDLIEHVVTWSADAPILLLGTARPELLEQRPDWGSAHPSAITMSLEALTDEESDRLISNLIGSSSLPDEAASIVDAAEGNPLFLEQLVGMLIDEGHLRREGDAWVSVGDLRAIRIPSTITGILEARLERLTPPERAVLERGAVEGRVFHWASVTALSDEIDPAEVGRHLLALARRGLIGPASALFGGGEAFRFRHALIRDAAYARLSKGARADLHERHARWVERTAGERVAEFEDVLAYHLEQSVRLRSELGPIDEAGWTLAREAARRLTSSAERAAARGDVRAASTLLDRAVRLLDPDDPDRPDLLVRFGDAIGESGDPDLALGAFDEARTSAARLGKLAVEMRARLAAAVFGTLTSPEGASTELSRAIAEAIPVLEPIGDDDGLALAWRGAGVLALIEGRGADMASAFERAAFHAERAGTSAALSDARGWQLAATVAGFMRPEEAIEQIRRIRQDAPDDRKLEAVAAVHEAMALANLGKFDDARARYRYGHGILADLGSMMWAAGTKFSSAWVEMVAGDPAAAERELRDGIEALERMGEQGYLSTQAAVLAQALYEQGRFEEAEEMAERAARAGSSDDISTQVPRRGVQAKLLARRGELTAAIELAEEAVAIMEGSDFLERGWALVDLAEVYEAAGRRHDALASLREALEVYEQKGIRPLADRTRLKVDRLERSA